MKHKTYLLLSTPLLIIFVVACLCSGTAGTPTAVPTSVPGHDATVVITTPTAVVTSTPKPAPLGETRDNPYPVGTAVDIGGGMKVTVIFVTRPANEIVAAGNMFNDTPTPNQEYAIVRLHVECTKPTNDKCNFSTYEFKAVGADGRVQEQVFVAGVPEELEAFSEMFGGSFIEGSMVFLVAQGDQNVVLFHEPLIIGDPVYFALQ